MPEKGSVGASGDLAPLSHLTLGMIGEGQMWSPETGWGHAADVRKITVIVMIVHDNTVTITTNYI